jgi:hypothetical protein
MDIDVQPSNRRDVLENGLTEDNRVSAGAKP